MDNLTSEERSRHMASIRGKDTGPELTVRRLVFSLGFRFRIHRSDLPGTPDLVLPRLKKVIFVHGCFWHHHGNSCSKSRTPKSRTAYWADKFRLNRLRDRRVQRHLKKRGWGCLIIWECQLKDLDRLQSRILLFLHDHPVD